MLYPLARTLLFQLEPERAHQVAFQALRGAHMLKLWRPIAAPELPVTVMGLTFANPVGIAAGLDKNAEYIDALGGLGPGFIEVGTLTPRPQPGNPRPRLFRLQAAQALINRFGFNNEGIAAALARVRERRWSGVLGINIGKNFDTPLEQADDDYCRGLREVYPWADYVTLNISSPNTSNLRQLQTGPALERLLSRLDQERRQLSQTHQRHVPLVIKIAPDLGLAALEQIADLAQRFGLEGIIATNTTVERGGVTGLPHAAEMGGLSGAPLFERSCAVVEQLAWVLKGAIPIIAAGGIDRPQRAQAMFKAGARLVQIYTGLIYRGPGLIPELVQALQRNDSA